jgi:hypothetical protein
MLSIKDKTPWFVRNKQQQFIFILYLSLYIKLKNSPHKSRRESCCILFLKCVCIVSVVAKKSSSYLSQARNKAPWIQAYLLRRRLVKRCWKTRRIWRSTTCASLLSKGRSMYNPKFARPAQVFILLCLTVMNYVGINVNFLSWVCKLTTLYYILWHLRHNLVTTKIDDKNTL